ncbi:HAD family acid phosphatase [Acidicapsa ligni]|uniref:HAD family acid phosphatase n=1 Tax=Acidicapsa ligni TaxID=542300 RepID=UPI0021DFF083|nr:HAD family acid phosphatase [Acidicapsa ligni]
MRLLALVLVLVCLPALGQQAVVMVPNEPVNLQVAKDALTAYQSCKTENCYGPQIDRQIDLAIGFLKQSVAAAKAGDKLALVLDIDETSLSNWSVETHDDYGYIATDSNWCVALRCGKAIAGTLRLFKEAEADHVAVFFITGRPEGQRADTEANLKAEGYDRWEQLYLRPEDHPKKQSVTDYKSGDRAEIVAKGYRIVLNVGDQLSDLKGPAQAEHSVKLPNPFYFLP